MASLYTGPTSSLAASNKRKLFVSDTQTANVSKKLRSFYEQKELTDIVLVTEVDNFKVAAHRNVLAASSDYFRAMFRSVMKEAKADEVSVGDIDGATLKLILDFMYNSSIELRSETFASVFKAADFLQMSPLVGACCDFMADELDASNCLGFALIADLHNYSDFFEKACTFAARNYHEVSKGEEFLTLNDKQLSKIISSDYLCISEEALFLSLATWFAHDKANRIKGIVNLLTHVRFALLTPQFIIKNRSLLCLECYETICSWLEWHLLPEKRSAMAKVNMKSRLSLSKMALLTGEFTDVLELQTFDTYNNEWEVESIPRAPILKQRYRVQVLDKKLVIAGGCINDRVLKGVECYDLVKKKWQNLPSMRVPRCVPGMAVINADLYVVGGCSDVYYHSWQRGVERFNFATRRWEDLAPTNTEFAFVKVAALNGCLYATGNGTRLMERYDPATNVWTYTAPKSEQNNSFGFTAVNGLLYVVGGTSNNVISRKVECYDPTRNIWQTVEPLRVGLHCLRCVSVNNRLLICMGFNSNGFSDSVEEYNTDTKEWKCAGALLETPDLSSNVFTL